MTKEPIPVALTVHYNQHCNAKSREFIIYNCFFIILFALQALT